MITLTTINPSSPVSDGPSIFNNNFSTIKQHIDDIEDLLNPTNNSLKLANKVTIPANSIEADTIALTAASGILITNNPNGNSATFTVSWDGDIIARKVVLDGTGANKSVIADLDITGDFIVTGVTVINELLDLTKADSRIARKTNLYAIVDANIGSGATAKIDISKDYIVQLDYDNGASALTGSADVHLDTSLFIEGQIFRLFCNRKNPSGMKLHNGGVSTEVFAFIEPNGAGYTTIQNTTLPEFNPTASPNNQSWVEVMWTDIGAGTFRLVILDSKNMLGVV